MDLHNIFEQANANWVRYSQYEYGIENDQEYLTPTVDAELTIYNPLQMIGDLLVDVLNLGALFDKEEVLTSNGKNELLIVVQKYGLLGFMTSIPLNGNFMEYPDVYFGRNVFFDEGQMKTRDYLAYFQPFGIKQGQPRSITGFEIPTALIMGRTLEYEIIFSRNYAERTDWLFNVFRELYMHFSACDAYRKTNNSTIKDILERTISDFWQYGLGFQIKIRNEKPTMVWDFVSLKHLLETVYAHLISQKDLLLRICKHCGKVFYAKHGRSEFCSGKCRNQYNVYKSRGKDK